MNPNLYYTVENILNELAWLVCHTKNLHPEIIDFYMTLQTMHTPEDLEASMETTGMSADELANEITDIYQDMLDLYINSLEIEASLVA